MQDTQMTLTQPKVDEQGLQVTSDNIPVKTWKTWYFDKDRYEKLPQSRRILIERPGFMQVLDKLKVERSAIEAALNEYFKMKHRIKQEDQRYRFLTRFVENQLTERQLNMVHQRNKPQNSNKTFLNNLVDQIQNQQQNLDSTLNSQFPTTPLNNQSTSQTYTSNNNNNNNRSRSISMNNTYTTQNISPQNTYGRRSPTMSSNGRQSPVNQNQINTDNAINQRLREILPQLEGLNQEEQLIKAQQELDQMDYELYLKELKELPVVFASEGQFSPQNAGDTQNLDEQQQQQQQQQTQLLSNTTSTPIRQRINNSSTTTRSHSIPHSTLMKDTQFYFTPQQLKKMNISTPFSQNMSQTYNSSSFLNQTARSQTQSRSNTAQQQYTERYIPSLAPPLTEDLEYNSKELNNIDLQVKTSMKRTKRFVEQTTAIEKGLYGKNITEIPPYNKNLRKVQTDLKHQRFLDSQQKDIKKQQGFLKSQNMIEQMHDNLVMQQTRQALTQNSLERMGAYNSQIGLLDLKEDSNSPIKYTAMYTPALTPDFASGSNRYQKPMAQTQTQSQQGTTRERFVAYERPKQLNPLLYGKAANLSRKLAEKEAQEEKQKELDKKGSKKDINNT